MRIYQFGDDTTGIVGTSRADAVTVVSVDGADGTFEVTSADADITLAGSPVPDCQLVSARVARCEPLPILAVSLLGGDDRYRQDTPQWPSTSLARAEIYSSGGDDRLTVVAFGADGAEVRVDGGDGDDRLVDRAPRDTAAQRETNPTSVLEGGAGADVLVDGRYMFGVGGADEISSAGREATYLSGGDGTDHLRADGGTNQIRGGAGADVIVSREDGYLSWAVTDDVVEAGRGRDTVKVANGAEDDVDCGKGADRVRRDWRDLAYRCEAVRR